MLFTKVLLNSKSKHSAFSHCIKFQYMYKLLHRSLFSRDLYFRDFLNFDPVRESVLKFCKGVK